jgi:hypothetical protein
MAIGVDLFQAFFVFFVEKGKSKKSKEPVLCAGAEKSSTNLIPVHTIVDSYGY